MLKAGWTTLRFNPRSLLAIFRSVFFRVPPPPNINKEVPSNKDAPTYPTAGRTHVSQAESESEKQAAADSARAQATRRLFSETPFESSPCGYGSIFRELVLHGF